MCRAEGPGDRQHAIATWRPVNAVNADVVLLFVSCNFKRVSVASCATLCHAVPRSHGSGSGYWSSENWDPDSRVYTGADIFQTHRLAVQPDKAELEAKSEALKEERESQEPVQPGLRRVCWELDCYCT